MKLRFNPLDVGWRIGDAHEPRGGELWVPWDRTDRKSTRLNSSHNSESRMPSSA
jgi:hypothetical protein